MFDLPKQRVAAMGDIIFPEIPFPDTVIELSDRALLLGLYYPHFSNALNTAIYTAIFASIGITTIWDKPGQPRPSLPYATLNLSPSRDICKADISHFSDDTYEYLFRKEATLSISIYDIDNSFARIQQLINKLNTPAIQAMLRQGDIAYLYSSPPLDLSLLLETTFENRSTVDIFLSYAVSLNENVQEVHSVTYEGICGDETTVDIDA